MVPVKNTNRNCFHLACLNRYRGCCNTLQSMLEELSDINLQLEPASLQQYEEAGPLQPVKDRADPRLV